MAVTLTVGSLAVLVPGAGQGLYVIVGVTPTGAKLVPVDSASQTSPVTVTTAQIQSTYASA
jgi:hypothetical protein